jgi:hypothetical protein
MRLTSKRESTPPKVPHSSFDAAPAAALTGLGSVNHSHTTIGTLSFPVKCQHPLFDNSEIIAEIVRDRHPAILLCAGWSVPKRQSLQPILRATNQTETVVLAETREPEPPVYYRICAGRIVSMGRQFFCKRKDIIEDNYVELSKALPERTFEVCGRSAVLLNCGEVLVVCGRIHVGFHRWVPQSLRDVVRWRDVLILNPTHTRMRNDGAIKAWRKWLSKGDRVYVSASNWDLSDCGRRQKIGPIIHSLWNRGKNQSPVFRHENEWVCYREWKFPAPRYGLFDSGEES